MSDEKTAAERIKEIRERTGLSQAKLGARYGIPMRTVQDWERGVRTPPPYVVTMLDMLVKKETDA